MSENSNILDIVKLQSFQKKKKATQDLLHLAMFPKLESNHTELPSLY